MFVIVDSDRSNLMKGPPCEYPSRLCDEGRVCVSVEQLCNNVTDCQDKSDENGQCGEQTIFLIIGSFHV